MSNGDWAFVAIELSLCALALTAARVFWSDLRPIALSWLVVSTLPLVFLYLGLSK